MVGGEQIRISPLPRVVAQIRDWLVPPEHLLCWQDRDVGALNDAPNTWHLWPTMIEFIHKLEQHSGIKSTYRAPESLESSDKERVVGSRQVGSLRAQGPQICPPTFHAEANLPAFSTARRQLSLLTNVQPIARLDEVAAADIDTAGETKVNSTGHLSGGREYSLKTFTVIGHGETLFMLGAEVSRLTGYRDSYLFFLRNRNLHKVVTTRTERDDLVQRKVIPFSYRYRQISLVTARSVFIHFGYRVIVNGHRIRDDYYENKSILQSKSSLPITEIQPKATKEHEHQIPRSFHNRALEGPVKQSYNGHSPPLPDRFPTLYRETNALR